MQKYISTKITKDMKRSNPLISFLQIYGIILVVIGHANISWSENNPLYIFRDWIYSYHMPLFIFISGYLLQYTLQEKEISINNLVSSNYWNFVFQKAKRLLLPYVFISSLVFFPKVYFSYYALRPINGSINEWIHMLIYPWDNVIAIYWFLPTLFIITIICILIIWLFRKFNLPQLSYFIITIMLLLNIYNPLRGFLLFNLEGVIHYSLYFILGIYYCQFQQQINKVLYIKSHIMLVATFFVSIILLSYHTANPPHPIPLRHPDIYYIIAIIKAVNGIIMSISLGYLYIEKDWSYFKHLYGSSSAIYLFSWFPQVISQQILIKLISIPWQMATFLAIITGIYIPFYIYKMLLYLKKNTGYGKYLALLLGQ